MGNSKIPAHASPFACRNLGEPIRGRKLDWPGCAEAKRQRLFPWMAMKYHVVTVFSRWQNLRALRHMLRPFDVEWHLILDAGSLLRFDIFEPWIHVYEHPHAEPFWEMWRQSINFFAHNHVAHDDDRYLILNDDDFYEPDFFQKVDSHAGEVVICTLLRGDATPPTADPIQQHPTFPLFGAPENMAPCAVGIEQVVLSGRLFKTIDLPSHPHADGMMISQMVQRHGATYAPEANIWFNYLEPGRWRNCPYTQEALLAARNYVGTNEISGFLQYQILKREGCQPSSMVLEIGCGCLNLAGHLVRYLHDGHYVGVDPNPSLREESLKMPWLLELTTEKRSRFLSNDRFDGSDAGPLFDYVFAHSVLSHCAYWQLPLFLKNTRSNLKPEGAIIASLRLAEGNAFGSTGTANRKDSMDDAWQYPGVSWFRSNTVVKLAEVEGLRAEFKPEYTAFYTQYRPDEYHDWVVFKPITA